MSTSGHIGAFERFNNQVFYLFFTFYQCTSLVRTIIISTAHIVCGIHVIDVLCGKYLYFSPMPFAYGLSIDLKIKLCFVMF